MRWQLQDGSRRLELYAPLHFSEHTDAEQFLRRFFSDAGAMQTLRDALRTLEQSPVLHHLHDDEVIRRVAALLLAGRLQLAAPESLQVSPVVWFKGSAKSKQEGDPKNSDGSEGDKNDTAKVPVEWQLAFSDGPAVKGFVSLFEPPNADPEELKPDGNGHHKKDGFWRHDPYAVTLRGTVEVSGKVEDEDGKAVAGVLILVEPVYSAPVQVKSDGGGAWKAAGFVEEEEFDVIVTAGTSKVEGKVEDSDGKAVPGAALHLILDGGQSVDVVSGKDGSFKVEDRVAGEGFAVELFGIDPGFAAEGIFEDEDGKPLDGIQAKIELDGGGQLVVTSGKDGKFRIPGLFPVEGFTLEVLNHPVGAKR